MRKVRLTTAILAMGLSAGFLSARVVSSARTISHRVPAQSSGAVKKDVGGLQAPAFAEARRPERLPVLLQAPCEAECRYQLKC
jgi:hypothetical protein